MARRHANPVRSDSLPLRRREYRTVAAVGIVVAALIIAFGLASLLLVPEAAPGNGGIALAQSGQDPAATAPPPKPVLPQEAKPLLDADVDAWMAGVAALRANPHAHDILVRALENQPNSPRKWRLAYHLLEWGTPSDLPVVEELLDDAAGRDRIELSAAMEALYPRPQVPVDLARVVNEFSFVPQEAPVPFGADSAGKWLITDFAIQSYHQDGLPIRLIERVMAMRGHSYDSRGALSEALQKQVQGRQWADFGERLLSPVYPVPARIAEEGLLQVKLNNPESRPLVVVLTFQCWYGRFEQAPAPTYVLVPAGQSALRQFPVKLIAPADPGRSRVFLRIREANVTGVIDAEKLEVAMRR